MFETLSIDILYHFQTDSETLVLTQNFKKIVHVVLALTWYLNKRKVQPNLQQNMTDFIEKRQQFFRYLTIVKSMCLPKSFLKKSFYWINILDFYKDSKMILAYFKNRWELILLRAWKRKGQFILSVSQILLMNEHAIIGPRHIFSFGAANSWEHPMMVCVRYFFFLNHWSNRTSRK